MRTPIDNIDISIVISIPINLYVYMYMGSFNIYRWEASFSCHTYEEKAQFEIRQK